jgi:transcriptional adapter 2-alpha
MSRNNNRLVDSLLLFFFLLYASLQRLPSLPQAEKKRSKEERDLLARLKVFSRFLAAEEYEALVDGIVDMKRLKKQIECYRLYRSMGIRTIDQVNSPSSLSCVICSLAYSLTPLVH